MNLKLVYRVPPRGERVPKTLHIEVEEEEKGSRIAAAPHEEKDGESEQEETVARKSSKESSTAPSFPSFPNLTSPQPLLLSFFQRGHVRMT